MGHIKVKIKIYKADKSKSEEVELLVDTGSTYSWISASVLDSLGILPKAAKDFKTIEGRIVKRNIGEVLVEL